MVSPNKLVLGFFLCFVTTAVVATTRAPRLGGDIELCNLQNLTASPPLKFEYEGGSAEEWNEYDNQFQCVRVVPIRKTVQPNSLVVPNYMAYPRLVFIEQGEGIIGIHYPGCDETFDPEIQQQSRRMGEQGSQRDSHQKVHRVYAGDLIAIPAGAVYWEYNDGNQEMVTVSVKDINNPSNQLDKQPITFFLASGALYHGPQQQPWQQQEGVYLRNIFSGFETELLAEAFNVDPQIVRAMQKAGNRGFIIKVKEPMQSVTPDEEQQHQLPGGGSNGLEETICSEKVVYNLDSQREVDIFSRQAGKVNYVNRHKLPILSYMHLSAEKGNLQPYALFSPIWEINNHAILYVLRGNAHFQIVSNKGQTVLEQHVNRGDIVVVPQFFAATARAGENGFEWVAFKTNASPMKSPIAGCMSVFRAMPLEVITNAYQISPSQAQDLKTNRETQSMLLSSQLTAQRS